MLEKRGGFECSKEESRNATLDFTTISELILMNTLIQEEIHTQITIKSWIIISQTDFILTPKFDSKCCINCKGDTKKECNHNISCQYQIFILEDGKKIQQTENPRIRRWSLNKGDILNYTNCHGIKFQSHDETLGKSDSTQINTQNNNIEESIQFHAKMVYHERYFAIQKPNDEILRRYLSIQYSYICLHLSGRETKFLNIIQIQIRNNAAVYNRGTEHSANLKIRHHRMEG